MVIAKIRWLLSHTQKNTLPAHILHSDRLHMFRNTRDVNAAMMCGLDASVRSLRFTELCIFTFVCVQVYSLKTMTISRGNLGKCCYILHRP